MLTTEQIEAIRERAEAVTEKEWEAYNCEVYESTGRFDEDGWEELDLIAECGDKESAEFIAKAREDVPALLAEVERLRDEISFILNVDMITNAYDAEHVAVSVKSWAHRALYGGGSE